MSETQRNLKKLAALITCGFFLATSDCVAIITVNDLGIVGTAEGQAGDNPGDATFTSGLAQTILNLGLGGSTTISGRDYAANGVYDYSGTIITASAVHIAWDKTQAGLTVDPSYAYAIAKYDGKNAGWILFDLGVWGNTLPELSQTIWGEAGTDQYQLSGYTLFNRVPDGGATIALLGIALVGVDAIRRKLVRV